MPRAQRGAVIALAVAGAVSLFILLRPGEDPGERGTPSGRSPAEAPGTRGGRGGSGAPAPRPPREIRVTGGRPVGGVARIDARPGDVVRLAVRADAADEVHVHGYDRSAAVGPEKTARVSFRATLEGVFEVELERSGVEIARLEVRR